MAYKRVEGYEPIFTDILIVAKRILRRLLHKSGELLVFRQQNTTSCDGWLKVDQVILSEKQQRKQGRGFK
jgi:hypothetical protein